MAWIRETVVTQRKWLSEEAFAEALALCQLMPGANTLNMAVFLGSQLRGWRGALAAVLGLTTFPFAVVLGIGVAYGRLQQGPTAEAILKALGSGAAGVALGTGIQMGIKHLRDAHLVLIAALVVLCLAFVKLNILAVVLLVVALAALKG
jgi:chromate transporter